jgi:hypothetical protein
MHLFAERDPQLVGGRLEQCGEHQQRAEQREVGCQVARADTSLVGEQVEEPTADEQLPGDRHRRDDARQYDDEQLTSS